ncbi:BspA family leucine-rich repeat surface protein [Companilactobacillus suantsaicola]|uniref:BspA family leucine-rich repeat surface protein n=1 Tax=Companilactobacillus suantsaicola TaxID=2487723 RepID=A0A4Z0JHX0_9LACO|nr:SLAP domain-containing protein [Companilactobacillus suantsaicola]TGD22550.1 BspA family leucine-rich repeat surface protein [Companilactobacillus suantsaicola]
MRFQQLKRDPNSIVRKRLVKSKKNWVVLSSLSIAGGLFLIGAPFTTVKADTISDSNVQTTVVNVKDKSSGNTDTQSVTKADPVENTQIATDNQVQTDVPTTDEKTTTETKSLTDTKQETSISTDNTSKTSDNLNTNINDVSTTTDAKTTDTDTSSNLEISKTTSPTNTEDSSNADILSTQKDETLQLKALTAMAPEASKINSGNGWEVDQTGTNLNITGQLDESTGKDDTRWGGNSSTITTININNKVTAPKNSSYLFSDMPNLTAINNLSNFDTTTTENTEGMFKNDSSIESIDLSNNNLATIKNASHMFENNSSLKTVTYPTKGVNNASTMNKIQDTSYMFANCISLTDPDVSGWQTHYINNMTAMFKNDANITDLNLQGWLEYAKNINTGDSSLGQGMFDGTDLQTITIGNSMYFSPETALTSKSGATWTNGSQKFLGVPITSDDGTVTGGIGSVYKGPGSSVAGAGIIASTYHAIAADPGTTVMNLITVPTNHGNITVEAQGNVGESSDVTLPETISVDGQTYITTAKTVKATFGQTMATADLDASGNAISSSNPIVYTGEPVVGTQKDIPTNLTGKITIDIPAGHVGDSIAVTIPKDQIPAGYHVVKPTINVTYTNDTTNPYLLDTSSVELVGNDVTKWSTPQDAIELPTGSNITVTGTTNSNGDPVKIGDTVTIAPKVPGYTIKTAGSATVIADADGNPVLSKINQPTYSANSVTSWSTDPDAVKIPNGQTTVSGTTNSSGLPAKIGDTVKIAPDVPGYTVSIPGSATIVANDNGTPKLIDITQPKYSANPVNLWSTAIDEISIPTGKVTVSGSTNSDNQPAHIGDTVTIAPEVPGYTVSTPGSATITADKDGNPILSKVVQPQYTANSVDSWSSTTGEINIPTGKITVSGTTNSDGQPAKIGDTVTIAPNVPGYTVSTPGSATIVANDDGTPKLINITQPKYSANSVSSWSSTENQIITPTGSTTVSGTTNSDDQPAHFGDKVTIAPDVPGYTISTPGSAIISADKDGNPVLSKISQPKYSANPVSSWSSTENEIAIPTGLTTVSGTTNSDGQPAKIGDTVTIDPDVPGYTITTPGSATIIADKDGNPILSKVVQPKYSANPVNTWSTATDEISIPTGKVTVSGSTNSDNQPAHFGDTVTIAPKVPGYTISTPGSATITADKDGNPILSKINQPTYSANSVTSWSTDSDAVKIPNGQTTVFGTTNSDNQSAHIGDTVTIKPEVPGYTISKSGSATIAADKDGNPVLTNITQPVYSANDVKNWSTTENEIVTPNGNVTVSGTTNSDNQPAHTGDTVTIAPEVPGYTISTPGSATITADKDGNPILSKVVQPTYSANSVTSWSTDPDVVETPVGQTTISGTTNSSGQPAKIGDTVTIKPEVPGYTITTPGSATITADKDGNPILSKIVQPKYSANPVNSWSTATDEISIPTGKITVSGTTNSNNQPAKIGDTVTIAPKVPGYTISKPGSAIISADKDGNPILSKVVQPKYSANPVDSWSSTTDEINTPTSKITVSGTTNSDGQPAKIGDTVTIAPKVPGYTISKLGSATITADKDGNPVLTNIIQPTYTANEVKNWSTTENEVIIPTGKITVSGTTNSENQPAHIGDTVTIAPNIPGYTISKPGSATITSDKDGNPVLTNITQPTYSANEVKNWSTTEDEIITPTGKVTVSGTTNSENTPAKIGDTVTITPNVPGYTISKPGSAIIISDKDGNPVLSKVAQPEYSPNAVSQWSTKKDAVVTPNGNMTISGDKNATGTSAKIGDKISITPEVPGYTISKPGSATITADKDGNPVLSDLVQPVYSPNDTKPIPVEFNTPNGKEQYIIPAGKVGDKVTVTIPNVAGYDPSTSEIKGTISANNTFVPDGDVKPADVKYLGKEINGQLSTVDVNLGNGIQSIKIPSGTVGSISGPIQLDYIEGYNRPAVKIQYTPSGFNILDLDNNPISKTSPVIYTGVKNPETSIKIQKPDGSIINVKVPEGHFGDKNVTLSLPSENGYITPSITVTYGPNGIPSFTNQAGQIIDSDNPVSYKGNINKASTVKVKNPDGTTSTLNIPEGRFGDAPITVTAIDKPGYTAPKVIVTFTPDGIATITNPANSKALGSDDVLSYTQIVSNESTSSAHIENIKSTIATFADQPDVQIYAKDSDNQMSVVNRKLVHNSDWLTDQLMTLNGDTFYRVATNEWVKASQVYLYKAETLSLQAKTDSDKQMIKAEGTALDNLLAKGTQFTSDRIAYINGQEYYRVGINQFVKISDTEIVNDQNINLTVATFSDQPAVQVYALNDDQITPANRKLMPQTDWLVDRQTTISGQKFYRVATNEWVKASQVYPFVYKQTIVSPTAEKKLYTAEGNLVANRKLNSDSAWKVDRIAYLNDEKYFRVATNEFVKAADLEKF